MVPHTLVVTFYLVIEYFSASKQLARLYLFNTSGGNL